MIREHTPETSDRADGIAADAARPEADGAVCGPVCVGVGTCACEGDAGDGTPGRAAATAGAVWAPSECALPAARQPEREAEFDVLFTTALREMARPAPTVLRLVLDAAREADVRDLAARESGCCSFFTFVLTGRPDGLHWEMTVPDTHVTVLEALAGRAAAVLRDGAR